MTVGQLPSVLPRDDQHETVVKLVAPFFLGMIINYFFWGVQVTQSYYYYKSYRKSDRTWIKSAVGLLFIADLVESICISQAAWTFLVNRWGAFEALSGSPGWGFNCIAFTDAFIASIVHFFYAQKIYTLLDYPYNYMGSGLVIALSCTQLTAGMGGTIFTFVVDMTLPEFPRFRTWGCLWLITASVTDIVITSLMTWKLSRSRTGFRKTDDIISKLIRLTIETGLATAIVQIVDIVVYLIWPLESFHLAFAFIVPKVYSNSMLALLNSRYPVNRNTTLMWGSSQDRPVDSIRIHTTQTVAASGDYELDDKMQPAKPRSENDRHTAPDAESTISVPFDMRDKGHVSHA